MEQKFEFKGISASGAGQQELVQMSIAISLKRLADMLQEARNEQKSEEAIASAFDDVDPHAGR